LQVAWPQQKASRKILQKPAPPVPQLTQSRAIKLNKRGSLPTRTQQIASQNQTAAERGDLVRQRLTLTSHVSSQGDFMKLRRDQAEKKKKKQPRDLALQFRELERLRIAVAKAEAKVSEESDDRKNAVMQKP
jgi:hypothetical protein